MVNLPYKITISHIILIFLYPSTARIFPIKFFIIPIYGICPFP